MRILIDLLHPAHVHFFRHLIQESAARNDRVLVTARDKDLTLDLLTDFQIPHQVISNQQTGSVGLTSEWIGRTARLIGLARTFRPDVMAGIMGVSIAPAGRLLRIPSVVFYDTENAPTNKIVFRLASVVATPDSYRGPTAARHVKYSGYHELAYLHRDRFMPSPDAAREFGVDPTVPYAVVRFVSWQASHDRGETGLSQSQKRLIVEQLGELGPVVVSSESALPAALEPYRLRGPLTLIHHLLAFAEVYVGESATMASEAAVLGTPAVYVASTGRGYLDDIEARFGLARHFTPEKLDQALDLAQQLMHDPDRDALAEARTALLSEKIDVTSWMLSFLDRYRVPAS